MHNCTRQSQNLPEFCLDMLIDPVQRMHHFNSPKPKSETWPSTTYVEVRACNIYCVGKCTSDVELWHRSPSASPLRNGGSTLSMLYSGSAASCSPVRRQGCPMQAGDISSSSTLDCTNTTASPRAGAVSATSPLLVYWLICLDQTVC